MGLEKTFLVSALAALALGISPAAVNAQALRNQTSRNQTLRDQVTVNLPQRVTVGNRTLEPGEYRIWQVTDNRVAITRNAPGSPADGVEAAVTQIITTFNVPPSEPKSSCIASGTITT